MSGVLTLACGKDIYFDMAATLARSFRCHHEGSEIQFVIATDDESRIPTDVKRFARVVVFEPDRTIGFELKLNLDLYTPLEKTLFVDADCLIAGSLERVFDHFDGKRFAAIGRNLNQGEWFGDIDGRCGAIGCPRIPIFVGAIYYFEKTACEHPVFSSARGYSEHYDKLNIVRLRDKKNEEPLLSIGMALAQIDAEPDDGSIKCDVMGFTGPFIVRIRKGIALFKGPVCDRVLMPETGFVAETKIAHFNDSYTQMWEYRREALSLKLHDQHRLPWTISEFVASLFCELPGRIIRSARNFLRPTYRRLFGVRRMRTNERS